MSIPLNQFHVGKMSSIKVIINRSKFAVVYCSIDNPNEIVKDFHQKRYFELERDVYLSIPRHPRICRYLGHHETCLYFKRYVGDLNDLKIKDMTVGDKIRIITDVIEGIKHMHDHGYAHADLKPGNIFVTSLDPHCARAVIGDLGLATPAEEFPKLRGKNYGYASPEHYKKTDQVGFKSDVWSIGLLVYLLLKGTPFLEGMSLRRMREHETNKSYPNFWWRMLTPKLVKPEEIPLLFIFHMYCKETVDQRLNLKTQN